MANPVLGVIIFTVGGLAGAIFYLPFKKVKNWAWESYWLIYAVFGLIVVPWILAFSMSPNVMSVLKASPGNELWYCYLCGAAWGIGGLTWGLMIRYLGVGLGLAIGCGLCSSAGTLIPKMLKGEFGQLFEPGAGIVSFLGVLVSIVGIVMIGMAGISKEKELPDEEKKKAVAEFNFKKGIIVAIFSGLMSSAMSFGLQGGATIEKLALSTEPVTSVAWKGMPVLVIVLLGGFTINFLWCLMLNLKNKTTGDYSKANTPLVGNIAFAAASRCDMVLAVHLFQDRRTGNGQDGLRRMGCSDGQRHFIQFAVGHFIGRVEENQLADKIAAGGGYCAIGVLSRHSSIQRLSRWALRKDIQRE